MRLIDADAIPWDVECIGDIPVITRTEIDEMTTVDLVFCHECQSHRNRVNMCDEWHRHTGPNGHCYKGRRYGQQTESKKESGRSEG